MLLKHLGLWKVLVFLCDMVVQERQPQLDDFMTNELKCWFLPDVYEPVSRLV